MPFITAGDPDLDFTRQLIRVLRECGCDLCEVGLPYSDPIADGPVIQASYTRALNAGVRLEPIFTCLAGANDDNMPLVAMGSYAMVHRLGAEAFVDRVASAGVRGAIVPDLPFDEAARLADICDARDFDLIQLIAPTTPEARTAEIARHSSGFIYYVSVTGITGARKALPPGLVERVRWLRTQTDLPICVGFGISTPEQVRALSGVADGVIVGSAIVQHLAAAADSPVRKLEDIRSFVNSMISAC